MTTQTRECPHCGEEGLPAVGIQLCPNCGRTSYGESAETKLEIASREQYHWKEALGTGVSLLIGLFAVASVFTSNASSSEKALLFLGGILLVGLSLIAFKTTNGWRNVYELSTGKKMAAYLPALVGGVAGIVFIIIVWIAREALLDSLRRA